VLLAPLGLEIRCRVLVDGAAPDQRAFLSTSTRTASVLLGGPPVEVDVFRYAPKESEAASAFRAKLEGCVYSPQPMECPICRNADCWLEVARSSWGFTWSVCRICGLFQQNTRLPDDQLNEFYETGEYQAICMGGAGDAKTFALEYKVMASVFLDIFDQLGVPVSTSSFLEIGCGSGGILLALKDRGADVRGYDLDPNRVAAGRAMVEEIEVGDALADETDMSAYDCVIVSNVLEHLSDPTGFVERLSSRLECERTIVVIDVPNLEGAHEYSSHFADFLTISHLWYFTSLSLQALLERAGLATIHIFNRGVAMTVLAKHQPSPSTAVRDTSLLTYSSLGSALLREDPQNILVRAAAAVERINSDIGSSGG